MNGGSGPGAALGAVVGERQEFLRFLERRVGSRDEAEDVFQAALLNAFGRASGLSDVREARAWFYRVLRNALADRRRRQSAAQRALESYAASQIPALSPGPAGSGLVCRCVARELERLKPTYRDILRRCDIEGRPVVDVAAELGIPSGNARVRLHRARAALRARVERSCGECAGSGCWDCPCPP